MTQNLGLALRARGDEGTPLPSAFKALEDLKAFHRRGQVSLVAAAPGGGKSAYATHYAIKQQTPTLYFSPDSDRMTLGTRALAGILGVDLSDAQIAIEGDDAVALEELESATEHVWWDFETGISLKEIKLEVDCYALVNGEYPSLLVLDNLKDICGDSDNQVQYHETIDFLHQLARETGAHVMILHHTKGFYENGYTPIPLGGLLNNVGKTPRLVLTLYRQGPGLISICIVKNSTGPSDPNCNLQVNIGWLPERSFFSE